MISYFLTRNGEPIAAGSSKDESVLTIGDNKDNDIVLQDVSGSDRFLVVTIVGSQFKLKCIGEVEGLKMYGIPFAVGQEKIISGKGGNPIEIGDYILEIKIGEPNSFWPVADIKKGRKGSKSHVDTFGASEQDRLKMLERHRKEAEKPKPAPKQTLIEKPLGQEIDALFDEEETVKPAEKERPKQKETYRSFIEDEGVSEILKPEKMKVPPKKFPAGSVGRDEELGDLTTGKREIEKKHETKKPLDTPKQKQKLVLKPIEFDNDYDDDDEFLTTERLKKELHSAKEEISPEMPKTTSIDYESDDDVIGVADARKADDDTGIELESEIFELKSKSDESASRGSGSVKDFKFKMTAAEEKAMDKLEEELITEDYDEDEDVMSFSEKSEKPAAAGGGFGKSDDIEKAVFGGESELDELETSINLIPKKTAPQSESTKKDLKDRLDITSEYPPDVEEEFELEFTGGIGAPEPAPSAQPTAPTPKRPAQPAPARRAAQPSAPPAAAASAIGTTGATATPAEPEPEAEPELMPGTADEPMRKKHKKMKPSAGKAGRLARAVDKSRLSDGVESKPQPASTMVGGLPDKKQSDIERKSTVRYYKQMSTSKNFPLLVMFTKEKVQEIIQRHVAQVEGKEKIKIKRDKPVVTIVPQFPGCICVPEKLDLDLTPDEAEARFWLTPVAEGKLVDAHVEIYYEGKKVQVIECETKVARTTAAKVSASAAIISPIFFSAIESVGFDPKAQVETGFPIVKQIADVMEEISVALFGSIIAGGMTLLGLFLGFIALIVAILFFIKAKPRKGSPIDNFLSFDVKKENLE